MPLIGKAQGWDRPRLLELLRSQQEGLEEIRARVEQVGVVWRDPMSRLTALELLRDAAALSERALHEPGLSDPLLTEVVNLQYSALLAAVDLLKSHANVPKVPQPAA